MSIEAILWHPDGRDEEIDLGEPKRRRLAKDQLLWVDLESADDDERHSVTTALGLSDDASEALRSKLSTPDARVLEGAVEIDVLSVSDGKELEPVPLQILMGREWIVTRHEAPLPYLAKHRDRLRDERQIGLLKPVEFLVSVLDWHVDSFFAAADELEHKVDELDEAALRRDDDLLQVLVAMRRRIAKVRRIVGRHREVFAELVRPDFLADVDEAQSRALAHEAERLTRAADAVSHVREMLIGTFDVHMTRTAQRTNDIMRVLTWTSVILLPGVVLAGIMGMNFKVGLFDNPNLFWVVIGFMLFTAVVTLVVARWRDWL
ncbi:MAG TPA: CorA family divalent cation transporter [Candidatus Limnocylindria bacterium]|nr:CorA family divalent cation transporter [Candidatus Limnocylindria bacterium]